MSVPEVRIYLKLGAVTDDARGAFLSRLESSLPPDMTLSEHSGQPCVRVVGPDDRAALVAVGLRVKRVSAEVGLDEIMWSLEPESN